MTMLIRVRDVRHPTHLVAGVAPPRSSRFGEYTEYRTRCGATLTDGTSLEVDPTDELICQRCVLVHDDFVVYRFYGAAGDLLYIGQTSDIDNRMTGHMYSAEWWHEVRSYQLEWRFTRAEAMASEAAAIKSEAPRYNRQYNKAALVSTETAAA